jgi:hypothetical protein
MEANKFSLKKLFLRTTLAAAALSGLLLFAGTSSAEARDLDGCQRRVNRAEWRLDEAVRHHGFYSREARFRREELREERARCFRRHRDWR